MPSKVWCARACYEVEGNPGEVAALLEGLPPGHTYCCLTIIGVLKGDRETPEQVAINPAHVSAIEPISDPNRGNSSWAVGQNVYYDPAKSATY